MIGIRQRGLNHVGPSKAGVSIEADAHADVSVALSIRDLSHAYFGRTVLDNIELTVASGEIVALIGPSGCGKSTLAHIAAGIIDPLRGTVARRYARHGMVFQELRLLPWATAQQNIAYPLRSTGVRRTARRDRVAAAAAKVSLSPEDLPKYPSELSGGMKQRTAIARALVVDPDFIYFDEPFTALDAALRRRMQNLVIKASQSMQFGALFITHDLIEAFRIADRVIVMQSEGRGILGERVVFGKPGEREDEAVFALVSQSLAKDPIFEHIQEVNERSRP